MINRLFYIMIEEYSQEERLALLTKAGILEETYFQILESDLPPLTQEDFRFDFDLMITKIENISFVTKTNRIKNILLVAGITYVWQLYAWKQTHAIHPQPSYYKPEFMWSFRNFKDVGKQLASDLITSLKSLNLPEIDTVTFSYRELNLLEQYSR